MNLRTFLSATVLGVPGGLATIELISHSPNKAEIASIHGKIQFVDSFPNYKVKIV